ncbi:hypothetical protein [Tropicibacter oceani]|uniref:Transporter n=1 Tax=Tropicibacter oceani TaxID=3058420 RepID=A0ABY8QCF6_9RHOB|nr:hypothetical protein [Tropicibacter oceani]WGW02300.1 hypothetical protein QF118_10070 [Tropicibacter oceani]
MALFARLIPLCLAFLAAGPLGAQSLSLRGEIATSATSVSDDPGVGRIDLDLSIPLAPQRGLPLAFEVGGFAYVLPGKRPHETYAALVWDDRWRLGVVRPAYDLILPSVFAETAPYLAYARAEYVRAFTTTTAMRETAVPFGLSYTHQSDGLQWAASLHSADKGGFRSASVAAKWDRAPWTVSGVLEGVWDSAGNHRGTNAKVGLGWAHGPWQMDLTYLSPGAERLPDALAASLRYQASQRLTLSTFGEVTADGSDDAFGVAAQWRLTPAAQLALAATRWRDDTGLHLTLSHRF